METLKSTKVDWKKITVVALLIIFACSAIGFGVWYYVDQQVKTQAEYYEDQLDKQKVAEDNNEKTEEITEKTSDEIIGWATYKNDDYGFQLTFSDNWRGYEVISNNPKAAELFVKSYSVLVPTTDSSWVYDAAGKYNPAVVMVYTKESWAKRQSQDGPKPALVGTSGNYVVGYMNAHDAPSDFVAKDMNFKDVANTFKAI